MSLCCTNREPSPSDMVYTQARLDEALSAFRECKKFLERRGLKTANLESHLGRKYELRRPPPETTFARRPTLWLLGDDDSDGEFEPSNGKKKKKNAPPNPKPARLRKRKLSVSGDDSGGNKNKRRRQPKAKGTTWAQGRRVGRIGSDILVFKFIKLENLQVLNRLIPPDAPGSEKMLHEEPVNVFNANAFDSGFKITSPSDLKGMRPLLRDMSEHTAGTIVDPSVGLATPRSSMGSIEAPHANIQDPFAIAHLPAVAAEPTRDLRNRVVSVNLVPVKKRYSCLACKEEGEKCSLLKSHQDYQGACDACEVADSPCRINEDDEPRMGPLDRIDLEIENRKRSAEGDGGRGGKRRNPGNGNIGSIFDQDDDDDEDSSSPGLGNSILKKRKDKKRSNLQLINELNRSSTTGFSGRDLERGLPPLNTSLANSLPDSKSSDSGYHSSFLTGFTPALTVNTSNTADTAISISSSLPSSPSPSTSPLFFPDASPARPSSLDPTDGTTTHITTPWAHPINFQHQPKTSGTPCHFCQDFRYGLVGLGATTVEVAWDQDAKNYIEIAGGHSGAGKETTRMCTACALERLRIRFCGRGHDVQGEKGKGRAHPDRKSPTHNHTLVEMPAWRALGPARNRQWAHQLRLHPTAPAYAAQPVMPPCHLCHVPATHRCDTLQLRNAALQPLEADAVGKRTCGLRVCDGCRDNVEASGGQWVRGKVVGTGERADAEFLFEGAGLERSRVWSEYLESVGLLAAGRGGGGGGGGGKEVMCWTLRS